MIHILLLILKIIGIILLSILGLIILLILLICLTPLKYEIYGQVNNSKESLAGKVKFGYFFNILNGQFVYKEGRPRYYVAVFKKKLICSKKPKEERAKEYEKHFKEEAADEPIKDKETVKEHAKEMKVPYEGEIKEDDFKYVEKPVSNKESSKEDNNSIKNNSSKKKDCKKKKAKKPKEQKKSRLASIKYKIKNMYSTICDKIRVLKEKKEIVDTFFNDKIHRKAILKAFKEIKVLLKKLKPYNLKGKIHYGFEDPELTGKSLAALSMVLPFIGGELDIQPDFNNELVYSGNISFKGKIKLSYFITLCIKLAVRKSIWTTFFDAKHIIDDMK